MRVGLIARCEDRGLGIMTWAFHRNMAPDATLLIRPSARIAGGFAQHPARFPGALEIPWDGGDLDEATVRGWLDGLDVVYSAETFYDPRIVEWAADAGVATVLHVMPELFNPAWPTPTATWLPTRWRAEHHDGAPIVPVPLDDDWVPRGIPRGELRVLHIAGHRAMADRNGSLTFLQSLRLVRSPIDATLLCQDRRGPRAQGLPARIRYRAVLGPQESLAPFLAEADVVVLPRRYGGLCLPALESIVAGCVVVMPDCSPNTDWPVMTVPSVPSPNTIVTAAGDIEMIHVEPRAVAAAIDELADDPVLLQRLREQSSWWCMSNSWDALRPVYVAELAAACARVAV